MVNRQVSRVGGTVQRDRRVGPRGLRQIFFSGAPLGLASAGRALVLEPGGRKDVEGVR